MDQEGTVNGPVKLVACVPVDRSQLPQGPELDAIVVTDLYTLKQCKGCGQDIWVGPRQLDIHQTAGHPLVCYICSFIVLNIYDLLHQEVTDTVLHLGGGFPVEGRARTT